MIELKLSQGASRATAASCPREDHARDRGSARARARAAGRLQLAAAHSVFSTPEQLMHFLAELRAESGGKPVGFKLRAGQPAEVAALCHAMLDTGVPDFITVDGAEGGTGAAPPSSRTRSACRSPRACGSSTRCSPARACATA